MNIESKSLAQIVLEKKEKFEEKEKGRKPLGLPLYTKDLQDTKQEKKNNNDVFR